MTIVKGDFIVTRYNEKKNAGVIFPSREVVNEKGYDPVDWVCSRAAKIIAFSDCGDEELLVACANFSQLEYVGWQPDMLFEFRNVETGEIVWSRCFPDWEH